MQAGVEATHAGMSSFATLRGSSGRQTPSVVGRKIIAGLGPAKLRGHSDEARQTLRFSLPETPSIRI